MKFTISSGLILLLVSVLVGCGTTQDSYQMGTESVPKNLRPLAVSRYFKFENIPIPKEYEIETKKSFVFQNNFITVGLLHYKGDATADQLVSFFREQMPNYGWRLLNVVEYGKKIMNFEAEQQTCIITIEPNGESFTIATSPRG